VPHPKQTFDHTEPKKSGTPMPVVARRTRKPNRRTAVLGGSLNGIEEHSVVEDRWAKMGHRLSVIGSLTKAKGVLYRGCFALKMFA
jgi:hypothetical protein